jgi:hypothetical protein
MVAPRNVHSLATANLGGSGRSSGWPVEDRRRPDPTLILDIAQRAWHAVQVKVLAHAGRRSRSGGGTPYRPLGTGEVLFIRAGRMI